MYRIFLHDPLAVEVEAFEPMKKKSPLNTNTETDSVLLISNLSVSYYPEGVTPQTVATVSMLNVILFLYYS